LFKRLFKRLMRRLYTLPDIFPSIKGRLFFTYAVIIIAMLVPFVISFFSTRGLSIEYGRLISNINYANDLNSIVKTDINAEIWNIVSGDVRFEEGKQFRILSDIDNRLTNLYNNASSDENRQKINVVRRTMITLSNYVYRLGDQIRANARVSENIAVMDEIQNVSSLAYNMLQDFMISEINSIGVVNQQLKRTERITTVIEIITLIAVILFAALALLSLTGNINRNIAGIKALTSRIADGDLDARARPTGLTELMEITGDLNIMANRISELFEKNIEEQKRLQMSKMQTLQAQITPHFLYNTFDTIIWLAQAERNKEVIDITLALSNFFRISLSHGKEWITVEKEIEHVTSYLTIQKARYGSILDYEISADKGLMDGTILKLLLQPLVENAIYHGVKNLRRRGRILVSGELNDEKMLFSVQDNGIGMTPEQLESVRKNVREIRDASYGMYNVNHRIRLYYGVDGDITIESEYGKGTRVSFQLPYIQFRQEEENEA